METLVTISSIIIIITAIYNIVKWYITKPDFVVGLNYNTTQNCIRANQSNERFSISIYNKGEKVDNVKPTFLFPKDFTRIEVSSGGSATRINDIIRVEMYGNFGTLSYCEKKNLSFIAEIPHVGEFVVIVEIRSSYIFTIKKKIKIAVI